MKLRVTILASLLAANFAKAAEPAPNGLRGPNSEGHMLRGKKGNGNTKGEGKDKAQGDGGVPPTPPLSRSGNVIISRLTEKQLTKKGKTKSEINAIRSKGLSEIMNTKVGSKSKGEGDFKVVDVGEGNEGEFIKSLDLDLYEYTEPDMIEYPTTTSTDDPYISNQYHHTNMQSDDAWNLKTGSSSDTVAIDDVGIQVPYNTPHRRINSIEAGVQASTSGTPFVGPFARFVKVTLDGAERILSLTEVQVFDDSGQDVALASRGAEASQSSNYQQNRITLAGKAINGVTRQPAFNRGFTHTSKELNPWWIVDLGAPHDIKKVVLWNRMDSCCTDRLSGATVSLLDYDSFSVAEMTIGDSTDIEKFELDFNWKTYYLKRDSWTVKVTLDGAERILTLVEVQVFDASGQDVALASRGAEASQSSVLNRLTGAGNAIDGVTRPSVTNTGFTHTAEESNPWWKVNLGAPRDIKKIVLWNRWDCCSDRLSYATVSILDKEGTVYRTVTIGDATGIEKFELDFN